MASEGERMKQQILIDSTEKFKSYIYEDGMVVIPESATIRIFKPDLGYVIEDSMAIASDGEVSVNLTAIDNSAGGENFKAVIDYTYKGSADKCVRFYDVVNTRLISVVTDTDVTGELPQIKGSGWKVMGTALDGSLTTLVDGELSNYSDDYFTGGNLYSIDKDELRDITGFHSESGVVETKPFTSPISTDKYILTRSYGVEIERAFYKLNQNLSAIGDRPNLILDPYDMKEVHIYLSVAEVCNGLSVDDSGFWYKMWREYKEKADDLFEMLGFKYKEDN